MRFAIVMRDELWEAGALREERLSWGEATMQGDEIMAVDQLDQELEPLIRPSATFSPQAGRRLTSARRIGSTVIVETVIVVRRGGLSVVTTPEHYRRDIEFLLEIAERPPELTIDYRQLPLLWRAGSAAVLLHEAAGHPAEHGKPPVAWPGWLSVTDEPPFAVDDTGAATRAVDLLRGGQPSAKRRASFTDVPLPRLSNVVVRQREAPFELPEPRLDVFLVGGGSYDPLNDTVTLDVAAATLAERGRLRRVAPFTIIESRAKVARSIHGAEGEADRYPGVICSSEGQEIVVGSHAPPLLLTRFDA